MTYLYLRCGEGQALSPEQLALLTAEQPDRVFIETAASPDALQPLLEQIGSGDCVVAERFGDLADDSRGFLALLAALTARGVELKCVREGFDSRTEAGKAARGQLLSLSALDAEDRRTAQRAGIERAREAGKYKGRKPIHIDDDKLSEVAARWRSGKITAREAMQELGLKPNTFYRRIKAKGEEAMKNTEEIKAAAVQLGKEIKEGVSAGAEELKEAAERVIAEAKDAKLCEKVKEAAEQVKEGVKEAEIGKKVKEAAEQVKEGVKEAEIGKKVKEAAEQVKEGVREAEIGKKVKEAAEQVKEGFESTCEVVEAEIDRHAEQLKRDVEDARARAELREEVRKETEEHKGNEGE